MLIKETLKESQTHGVSDGRKKFDRRRGILHFASTAHRLGVERQNIFSNKKTVALNLLLLFGPAFHVHLSGYCFYSTRPSVRLLVSKCLQVNIDLCHLIKWQRLYSFLSFKHCSVHRLVILRIIMLCFFFVIVNVGSSRSNTCTIEFSFEKCHHLNVYM